MKIGVCVKDEQKNYLLDVLREMGDVVSVTNPRAPLFQRPQTDREKKKNAVYAARHAMTMANANYGIYVGMGLLVVYQRLLLDPIVCRLPADKNLWPKALAEAFGKTIKIRRIAA